MGDAGPFFQNGACPHMGTGPGLGALQKYGIFKITALEFNLGADIAVLDGNRCFTSQFGAITDQGLAAEKPASGMDKFPMASVP